MSSSGKQVQFVDDKGTVYATSSNYLLGLIQGTLSKNFILMSRLPIGVSEDRYPKSPLWDPSGMLSKQDKFKNSSAGRDISSQRGKKEREQKQIKEDISPW